MKKHLSFYYKYYLVAFGIVAVLAACSPRSEYYEWLGEEMDKNVREDSLLLGVQFGMSSKAFYSHCWELNKQGLIRQGAGNTSVLYELDDELRFPAEMNFYPTFEQDTIVEMPVTFRYNNWAPWNKAAQSDSLQHNVLKLMQQWYGKKFITITDKDDPKKVAFVRLDANRRISISKKGAKEVVVLFTDLSKEMATE